MRKIYGNGQKVNIKQTKDKKYGQKVDKASYKLDLKWTKRIEKQQKLMKVDKL